MTQARTFVWGKRPEAGVSFNRNRTVGYNKLLVQMTRGIGKTKKMAICLKKRALAHREQHQKGHVLPVGTTNPVEFEA